MKVYLVELDDRDYDAGSQYNIGAFTKREDAEILKQKVEQVFRYIEQRVLNFYNKHPDVYPLNLHERLINTIKKNPNFKFMLKVSPSYWFIAGPSIRIKEIELYEGFYDYQRNVK